jgi:hypothetical protein
MMLATLAKHLALALHTPPAVGSALCRSLTRVNASLTKLTSGAARVVRDRLMVCQAAALSSALQAFPADEDVMRMALEFFHVTLETPQACDADSMALCNALASALAQLTDGATHTAAGLRALFLRHVLPAYFKQACYSVVYAAAAVAAARTAQTLFQAAAPSFDAHASLPLLLAPLLQALAPKRERSDAPVLVPFAAVRAAVYRLLALIVARFDACMPDALSHAEQCMPSAATMDSAPLRAGMPVPHALFSTAVGRLLVAALRDATGAVQHAAASVPGAGAAVAAEQAPYAMTALQPLDSADADDLRTQLQWALGRPPPLKVFDTAFAEFQLRKASLAVGQAAAGATLVNDDIEAACAALDLATSVVACGGADGLTVARHMAHACAPAVQLLSERTAGGSRVLVTFKALAFAAHIDADGILRAAAAAHETAAAAAAAAPSAPPAPTAAAPVVAAAPAAPPPPAAAPAVAAAHATGAPAGSQPGLSQQPGELSVRTLSQASRPEQLPPKFVLFAVLRPRGKKPVLRVDEKDTSKWYADIPLEDDSTSSGDRVGRRQFLRCFNAVAVKATKLADDAWASEQACVLRLNVQLVTAAPGDVRLCATTITLAASDDARTHELAAWMQRAPGRA